MAKRMVGCRVTGGELAPRAYAIYEDVSEPRDECARREICADGGVTAEMVVAKEMRECCDLAAQSPCPECPAKTAPDEQCPKCGGDCSAANPPVFDCPMIGCNRDF